MIYPLASMKNVYNACDALCKDSIAYSSCCNLRASLSAPEVIKKPSRIDDNPTKSLSKRTTQLPYTSSQLDRSHTHGGLSLNVTIPTRTTCTISPTRLDLNTMEHDIDSLETPARYLIGCSSISCYDLISILGRGAYGTVLLAHRKGDPRRIPYAIKVLQKASIAPYGTQEIVRELKTLTLIAQKPLSPSRSPSINGFAFMQRLAESFQNDKYVFIVLEYHPTTLLHPDVACLFRLHSEQEFAALTASASLPVTEDQKAFSKPSQSRKAVLAALQLLSAEIVIGLLFLHQMGIIHQDIKPSNILISKTGHVVIGDFGAATRLPLVSRDTVNSGEPIFGAVVLDPDDIVTFTPLYAAPELLERDTTGLLIYNERVDWWSLGVLLYELVTGTVPFRFHLNGTRCVNEGRRSDGDRSLSFGPLEKLGVCHDDESDEAKALDQFLRALLLRDPRFRLFGESVKTHSFFESLADKWEEIAALRHPPCLSPPTDCGGDGSPEFNACFQELTSYQTQEECIPPSADCCMTEESIDSIAQTQFEHVNESQHLLPSITRLPRTTVFSNAEFRSCHTRFDRAVFDFDFKGERSPLQAFPSTASFRLCMPNRFQFQPDQDVDESELQLFPSSASIVEASSSEGFRKASYNHDASEHVFHFPTKLSQHAIPRRETPIYSFYKSHFNDSGLHIPSTPPLIRKRLPSTGSAEFEQSRAPSGEGMFHDDADERAGRGQPLDQFDINDDSGPLNFPPECFLPRAPGVLPPIVHETPIATDRWTFDERIALALLGAQTLPPPVFNVRGDRRLSNASIITSVSEKIMKGTKRWLQGTVKRSLSLPQYLVMACTISGKKPLPRQKLSNASHHSAELLYKL